MENEKKETYSFFKKCLYGCADIYGGGAFVVISTFFTVFLTKSLGMSTALAGTIPLIGKVWDAVTDPIMGNIADRTQSKLGAKRLYILIGSVISAITFLLMWVSFPMNSQVGQYFFYMLMYMLFSTGFTIVMVPYNALLPDMVEDYTVRAGFSGVRMVFSTFGAILAGLVPTIMIKDNTDAGSYFKVALIFSVVFLVAILITFIGTWEKPKAPVRVSLGRSFVQSLTVYKSRAFRIFIAIFLLGQGAADFVTGLAVYYVDDVLDCYHDGMFTILMGVLLVAQFIGTIIFSFIMKKTSKRMPIFIGFPLRIVSTLALLFFSHEIGGGEGIPKTFYVVLILSFLIGLGMAASSTSIYAILADMADVDELITSIYRSGTCSAMATFIRKICTGLSSTIIGLFLTMVGYDEMIANAGGRQSSATQTGISALYVLLPVVFMIGTIVFAVMFPMGKKEFAVIKKEIARRKGEDDSTATEEEKRICEKITGFAFNDLWNPDNALKFKKQ